MNAAAIEVQSDNNTRGQIPASIQVVFQSGHWAVFVKHEKFDQEFQELIYTNKELDDEIKGWKGKLEAAFKEWGYVQL